MIARYSSLPGKITFEEFSNKMENRQQEAGEEDDDIEMTGVSYDPSKVVVKKEPVEGEEEEEEEEEAVGSDEEIMYEDDTNDKDWVPSASEHYSECECLEVLKAEMRLPEQRSSNADFQAFIIKFLCLWICQPKISQIRDIIEVPRTGIRGSEGT